MGRWVNKGKKEGGPVGGGGTEVRREEGGLGGRGGEFRREGGNTKKIGE